MIVHLKGHVPKRRWDREKRYSRPKSFWELSLSAGVMVRRGIPDPRPKMFWEVSLSVDIFVKSWLDLTCERKIFLWTQKIFKFFAYCFSNLKFCLILPGHMRFLVPFSAKWVGQGYSLTGGGVVYILHVQLHTQTGLCPLHLGTNPPPSVTVPLGYYLDIVSNMSSLSVAHIIFIFIHLKEIKLLSVLMNTNAVYEGLVFLDNCITYIYAFFQMITLHHQ